MDRFLVSVLEFLEYYNSLDLLDNFNPTALKALPMRAQLLLFCSITSISGLPRHSKNNKVSIVATVDKAAGTGFS